MRKKKVSEVRKTKNRLPERRVLSTTKDLLKNHGRSHGGVFSVREL
jgi:hypothetical protein